MTSRQARRTGYSWCRRVLLAASIAAGCSGINDQASIDQTRVETTRTETSPIEVPSLTGTSACFYARDVQNFTVLDRSNVIVYAPNDANAYHLRISPPSSGLRFAESLAFLPAGGRICGYAGDRLIVGPPTSAERLAIIDVGRLSPGSLEMLRGVGRAEPAAPRPQPGPGADVEGEAAPKAPAKADSAGET